MTEKLKYTIFSSDMGWVGILASPMGLVSTTLPQSSAREVQQLLGDSTNHAAHSPSLFDNVVGRLQAYFSGQQVVFNDILDLSTASCFQRDVWQTTRLIPYGEIRSYRWVAEQIKKPGAARAVGQALSRNPLPVIVPCHRVTASSDRLGGFTGGIEMKKRLLRLETADK